MEDTDAKREVPGAVEGLINTLKHYGIQFDEGATIDGDSVDLEVMLRERPRVMNWSVTGVSKGKGKDLIDETLKLKRGHELSDHIIDRNIKLLKEHFGEKGFLDCDIDVKIEPDTVIKQAVNVTFDVDKKRRIRIGEITFEGNENFDNKRLSRTFKKTHKVSPYFWQKTKFNEKEYEEDKEIGRASCRERV